jgi:hypothetical protein
VIHAPEPPPLPNHDVLVELLHSLSQPLTALHCSLELSLDQDSERPAVVSSALKQTDRVIDIIRLMREYLDSEHPVSETPSPSVPLGPAVLGVLEQLSVVAEAREIPLLASLCSKAVIAVPEFWLHRALHYLIGALVEGEPCHRAIVVLLEDGPARCRLSVHSLPRTGSAIRQPRSATASDTLRQVRRAIAWRILEAGGALLESYGDDKPGFVVSIPRVEAQVTQRLA